MCGGSVGGGRTDRGMVGIGIVASGGTNTKKVLPSIFRHVFNCFSYISFFMAVINGCFGR